MISLGRAVLALVGRKSLLGVISLGGTTGAAAASQTGYGYNYGSDYGSGT